MAARIPITHASYSAMLLVQSKHNLAVMGIYCLSGEISTAPIPCPNALEDLSKYRIHVSLSSSSLKRDKISSSEIQVAQADNPQQAGEPSNPLEHCP